MGRCTAPRSSAAKLPDASRSRSSIPANASRTSRTGNQSISLTGPNFNGALPRPGAPFPADDPAWAQRLNGKADAWKHLCVDLLAHPIASRVTTLQAAAKVVAGLGPPRLKVPHIRLPGRAKTQAPIGEVPASAGRA